MFTGRLKTEIPKALSFLSKALIKAGAKLEILDLSDNASGPIGVQGIEELLKSPVCYSLKELKLNNMGLGIQGAKLLSDALLHCYEESKKANETLGLKVFIAGRNRLENAGAISLARFFQKLKSLEEVQIPQNGIYETGVKALAIAFAKNSKMKIINLNDNTLNPEGANELSSKALPKLQELETLDIGDCLIKTEGAYKVALAFQTNVHSNLKTVNVGFNSIKIAGGIEIATALSQKPNIKSVIMDGNQFGEEGILKIKDLFLKCSKKNAIDAMSEDEGNSEDDDDSSYDDEDEEQVFEEEEELEEEEDYENGAISGDYTSDDLSDQKDEGIEWKRKNKVAVAKFLSNATSENFLSLGSNPKSVILKEIQDLTFRGVDDKSMKMDWKALLTKSGENKENMFEKMEIIQKRLNDSKGKDKDDSEVDETKARLQFCCGNEEVSSNVNNSKDVLTNMKNNKEDSNSTKNDVGRLAPELGQFVEYKLSLMDKENRLQVERLIFEVLYEGQRGNLTEASTLVV